MSGSGATCFGMFMNEYDAKKAANIIEANYPDWWVKLSQLISVVHNK
jgi:4-diphosphocytidyl-2-C-methyl-D-erythritol kinase